MEIPWIPWENATDISGKFPKEIQATTAHLQAALSPASFRLGKGAAKTQG